MDPNEIHIQLCQTWIVNSISEQYPNSHSYIVISISLLYLLHRYIIMFREIFSCFCRLNKANILQQKCKHNGLYLYQLFMIKYAKKRKGKKKLFMTKAFLVWNQLNAGTTVQVLLDVFNVWGIVHYGTAGSSNNSLSFGDVSVPKFVAFTGSWTWMVMALTSCSVLFEYFTYA